MDPRATRRLTLRIPLALLEEAAVLVFVHHLPVLIGDSVKRSMPPVELVARTFSVSTPKNLSRLVICIMSACLF